MQNEIILKADNIVKCFYQPDKFQVLKGVGFEVKRGEFVALVGKSGSGKSTLLYVLSTMDTDYEGGLTIKDTLLSNKKQNELAAFRNEHIGFVFQFHHLIEAFTAIENILMPIMVREGRPTLAQRDLAKALLAQVGLEQYANSKPSALSGGQQQRIAIARALISHPALLLADEPTGNLDTKTADSMFELFHQFNNQFGCAVLIVTHDPRLSASCGRTITLIDGLITQ